MQNILCNWQSAAKTVNNILPSLLLTSNWIVLNSLFIIQSLIFENNSFFCYLQSVFFWRLYPLSYKEHKTLNFLPPGVHFTSIISLITFGCYNKLDLIEIFLLRTCIAPFHKYIGDISVFISEYSYSERHNIGYIFIAFLP